MNKLTALEIYSIEAITIDEEKGQVEVWLGGEESSCMVEYYSRSEDESREEMRLAGYVEIENGFEFGKEMWVSAEDIQS